MKIKSLYIEEYKNIKKQTFGFKSHNGITLIIGNNGSGKSNLLECISDIFYNLYTGSDSFKTNFRLEYYDNNSKLYKVEWDGTNISKSVNGYLETLTNPFILPSRVVALYSGEENRLWMQCYYKFYMDFIKGLNKSSNAANIISSPVFPKMLYLNRYYWNIALLSLACNENNKKFIEESLDIRSIESITFEYGKKDDYDNYAISDILTLIKNIDDEIEYTIDTFKSKIERKDEYYDYGNLFMHLYLASTAKGNKLIKNIEIAFNGGQTLADLSEGAKKRLLIKAALEFGGQEDSLFLLDEPDAHVHISNKHEIYDIIAEYSSNRHVILTSHSPTMCKHIENKDSIMMLEDGKPKSIGDQIEAAIDLIGDRSAIEIFFTSKHIIFVEGKLDKLYISKAKEVLSSQYPNLDFDIYPMGGVDSFRHWGLDKLKPFVRQKIICYIDKDRVNKNTKLEDIARAYSIEGVDSTTREFLLKNKIKVKFYPFPQEPDGLQTWTIEDFFEKNIIKPLYLASAMTIKNDLHTYECSSWDNKVKNNCSLKKFLENNYLNTDFPKEAFQRFEVLLDDIQNELNS